MSFGPVVDDLPEGGLVMGVSRSGGPFDPLGARGCDVQRADDVVALVDSHPGRWVMVTLTLNRSLWLSPAMAYDRVKDRVREVARAVSLLGIHVTALELQGLTGEGWPHWHLIVYSPDDRTREEIKARVERAWTITTEWEHVDEQTGEVTIERSRESIGFSRVDIARERQGVARYAAKYLLKPWDAVPAWMGESRRQLRKLRLSVACFEWLETVGRHRRHRGGRRVSRARRRPARRLYDRMARSGLAHAVFRKREGRLVFERILPVPWTEKTPDLFMSLGARVLRPGRVSSLRWTLSDAALQEISRRQDSLRDMQRQEFQRRRLEISEMWHLVQDGRQRAT